MAYTKPQVLVFQEFQAVPTAITDPLRAHVSGPHAALHRHSNAAEKALVSLGEYDPAADSATAWPGKKAGSRVDLGYTKLFIDGALLEYFADLVGTGSTVAPVSGRSNWVRSNSVAFADNGEDYPRDAALLRDVRAGDTAYVRGTSGGHSYELWTYVKGFKGETVAATRGAAAADPANHTAQGFAVSVDKVGGADNTITVNPNAASYDGRADGALDETYTVEVTSGSVGGDLTTARLRVTSASGNDDASDVAAAAELAYTAIGSRGLLAEFVVNRQTSGSSAAGEDEVAPTDLIPGQKWKIHVVQSYAVPTATASGTYTGDWDTTYIAEVHTGGDYGDDPKIVVTTTTGVDVSGPTTVTDSGVAVAVGTEGVLLTFTGGDGLAKGDKWRIDVTAVGSGAYQTLVLGHDLPTELASAADLDLRLYIKKDIQVTADRTGFAPEVNWEASATEFTVKAGIVAYDSSWDDGETALDVKGGEVFVEYREWLPDFVGVVESLDDPADVSGTLGPVHPDNPLAYGVYKALSNSNGTPVRFTAVANPDSADSWSEVVSTLVGRDDVYTLVPLTHDRTVLDLYAAHVQSQSSAEAGRWRACMVCQAAAETKPLVTAATSDDGEVVLATLADDPDTSGTQYTILRVASGNAELEALGVRPGDVVRFLFTTDGFGNQTYTSFEVDEVLSETSLRLVTGHTAAIGVAQKVEIWKTLARSEVAAAVAAAAGSFASSRVCSVWPDRVSSGGVEAPGYHLAAALAGLRSGVVPHQGLTNVQVAGFDDLSRTTEYFNNNHLDAMAGAGVWVVTQDPDGTVYSRHALTTDTTDVNHSEEMVRANVDSMSYVFLNNLKPFIGRSNVTPTALTQIRVQLDATVEYLRSNGFTETLGSQLIDGEVTQLRAHALLKDRVVGVITLQIPYPLNTLECHLVI